MPNDKKDLKDVYYNDADAPKDASYVDNNNRYYDRYGLEIDEKDQPFGYDGLRKLNVNANKNENTSSNADYSDDFDEKEYLKEKEREERREKERQERELSYKMNKAESFFNSYNKRNELNMKRFFMMFIVENATNFKYTLENLKEEKYETMLDKMFELFKEVYINRQDFKVGKLYTMANPIQASFIKKIFKDIENSRCLKEYIQCFSNFYNDDIQFRLKFYLKYSYFDRHKNNDKFILYNEPDLLKLSTDIKLENKTGFMNIFVKDFNKAINGEKVTLSNLENKILDNYEKYYNQTDYLNNYLLPYLEYYYKVPFTYCIEKNKKNKEEIEILYSNNKKIEPVRKILINTFYEKGIFVYIEKKIIKEAMNNFDIMEEMYLTEKEVEEKFNNIKLEEEIIKRTRQQLKQKEQEQLKEL